MEEEVGEVVHVGGLKVEEVKEGRVVVGERGRRRGERRGGGGKALGEGGVGEDARAGLGERSREDAGGKGRGRRPELGLGFGQGLRVGAYFFVLIRQGLVLTGAYFLY